jgi:hypothetical protein
MGELQSNSNLKRAFILHLGHEMPFAPGILKNPGNSLGYPERINQIMECNGKDSNSLRDLMELRLCLESTDSRNAILKAWKEMHVKKSKSR